jgi:transposase
MLLGDGMARAYSSDLRIRVIRAVEGGFSARGAGRRLGIGESTATAWVGRWRRTGSAEAKSQKGRSRSPLTAHTAWLLTLIGERADLTLEEIRGLLGERGVQVGVSSIWRFFDRHGISFKKNRARHRAAARRRSRGTTGVAKACSRSLIRGGWCLSTRPAPPPIWPAGTGAVGAVPG